MLKIPRDGASQCRSECLLWRPAKLLANLARIDGIARIVARSVSNESYQFPAGFAPRQRRGQLVKQVANHAGDVDVAFFVLSAHVVTFANAPRPHDQR